MDMQRWLTPHRTSTYERPFTQEGNYLVCLAKCISLGRIVMHFTWIAHKLVSSRSQIRYASVASCNVSTAPACMWWSLCSHCNTSFTNHKKGALGISNSVDFWNLWISLNALVPGLNCLLLTGSWLTLGFIFLSLFMPIWGVFPFLPFVDIFLHYRGHQGQTHHSPFSHGSHFITIFCDEKYLK